MSTVIDTAAAPRKTKPRGRHPYQALSAAFIRTAPPGRHADGNGLYLFVQPSGTRSWIQRLVIRGRRRELGLGSVALVSLAEAREKARANRKLAREGGDPLAEKRRSQGVPSFAEAAARVVEQQQAGWRDPKYPKIWLSSLERYAFARIGKMPVSEVTSADLLEVLGPIWHVKAPTARTVRQRMHGVLEWAVAMETPDRQPLRPDRASARPSERRCAALPGVATSRGGIGHSNGTGYGCAPGPEAGLRVPGADGGAVERGARGPRGRRSIRERVCGRFPPHA